MFSFKHVFNLIYIFTYAHTSRPPFSGNFFGGKCYGELGKYTDSSLTALRVFSDEDRGILSDRVLFILISDGNYLSSFSVTLYV